MRRPFILVRRPRYRRRKDGYSLMHYGTWLTLTPSEIMEAHRATPEQLAKMCRAKADQAANSLFETALKGARRVLRRP